MQLWGLITPKLAGWDSRMMTQEGMRLQFEFKSRNGARISPPSAVDYDFFPTSPSTDLMGRIPTVGHNKLLHS
jgi:hypothetical protein